MLLSTSIVQSFINEPAKPAQSGAFTDEKSDSAFKSTY